MTAPLIATPISTKPMTDATSEPSSARRAITGFFATSIGLSTALLGLGMIVAWVVDRAMLPAIAAGVGCGLLAAMIGAMPVILWRQRMGSEGVPIVLMSMIFRVVAAIVLALACLQISNVDPRPLILSLMLTHAVLQVADIRLAKQLLFPGEPS